MESEEQDYQGAQEKFQQAAAAFEKATTINPDFYEAWRDRANMFSRSKSLLEKDFLKYAIANLK